jgi:hypothetical protein
MNPSDGSELRPALRNNILDEEYRHFAAPTNRRLLCLQMGQGIDWPMHTSSTHTFESWKDEVSHQPHWLVVGTHSLDRQILMC